MIVEKEAMKYHIDLYASVKININSDAKAYANILCLGDRCKSFAEGFSENSQSRISLMGIVKGLEQIKQAAVVTIHSSSKYVWNTYEKGWLVRWRANNWLKKDGEPPLNLDLWKRFALQLDRHQIQFNYVPYKQENAYLAKAKALGAEALVSSALKVDKVYHMYLEELNLHLNAVPEILTLDEQEQAVVSVVDTSEEVEITQSADQFIEEDSATEIEIVADKEDTPIVPSAFESLASLEDEEEDTEQEEEDSQVNSRPTILQKMPSEIKVLVGIRDLLNKYFASHTSQEILRSTDLYDLIKKNKVLKERFPHSVLLNSFLRRQHQEGILKQIIPNCCVDTFNEDFYQWRFHRL